VSVEDKLEIKVAGNAVTVRNSAGHQVEASGRDKLDDVVRKLVAEAGSTLTDGVYAAGMRGLTVEQVVSIVGKTSAVKYKVVRASS
jgi:hypothetical protein